jgi:riboflavin synthase
MFTGLVAELGRVQGVRKGPGGAELAIASGFRGLVLGESIAVNGCCLTVTALSAQGFTADASHETLARTTTGALRAGHAVHLERALALGDRLGGHLVTGHVDGVGRLVARAPLGDAVRLGIEVPAALSPFLAPKGSITLDGASLTVNGVDGLRFEVVLVPFTQKETLFGQKTVGDALNVEVDVLAKYVARLLGRPGVDGGESGGLSHEALVRAGFVGS